MQNDARKEVFPSVLNLGSGDDFREDCLNIDTDPRWGPDLAIDLGSLDIGERGMPLRTQRFGDLVLAPGSFETIVANHVLEQVSDLAGVMKACLTLLKTGGTMEIKVAYDLSYGAWQDPANVRSFNERSWLHYTDWFWFMGWRDARFEIVGLDYIPSPYGRELGASGLPIDEVSRRPRAIDGLSVKLRKVRLSPEEREITEHTFSHGRSVEPAQAPQAAAASVPAAPVPAAVKAAAPVIPAALRAFNGGWQKHRNNRCIWIVTHDSRIYEYASRILHMEDGKLTVEEKGRRDED